MRFGRRLLLGTLGFLSLIVLGAGSVYVVKPGNCSPLKEYGPYNQQYDVAFLYGGGLEKSILRAQETARLKKEGYFPYIVTLGTQSEVDTLINTLTNSGTSQDAIIPAVEYSTNTRANIETGNRTVKERKLGNRVAHVSGRGHLKRIKRDNISLSVDLDPSNDGFFPINDGFGTPFYQLMPNFRKIKTDSDLTAWYVCLTR